MSKSKDESSDAGNYTIEIIVRENSIKDALKLALAIGDEMDGFVYSVEWSTDEQAYRADKFFKELYDKRATDSSSDRSTGG